MGFFLEKLRNIQIVVLKNTEYKTLSRLTLSDIQGQQENNRLTICCTNSLKEVLSHQAGLQFIVYIQNTPTCQHWRQISRKEIVLAV